MTCFFYDLVLDEERSCSDSDPEIQLRWTAQHTYYISLAHYICTQPSCARTPGVNCRVSAASRRWVIATVFMGILTLFDKGLVSLQLRVIGFARLASQASSPLNVGQWLQDT
jgi:hypothetical protein